MRPDEIVVGGVYRMQSGATYRVTGIFSDQVWFVPERKIEKPPPFDRVHTLKYFSESATERLDGGKE